MGNRAVITVKSTEGEISLYGHWSGDDNLRAVENVLKRTDRIGDPSYLTAQLFYEYAVNLGGYDGQLSFGIFSGVVDSYWMDAPTVIVNADTGEYCIEGEETITTYAKPYPQIGKAAL
jgi:hypothetical protein